MHPTKTPAQNPPRPTLSRFGWGFVAVVVGLNLCALGYAWRDRSFGAFAVALIYGPAGNALLAVFSLAAAAWRRYGAGFSMHAHLALSLGVPAVAAVADYLLIRAMGLHGC